MSGFDKTWYATGTASEGKVEKLLKRLGFNTRKPSREEDLQLDIDLWVNDQAVSVKEQQMALKTGNLCFELEVDDRVTGMWEHSWWYNGEASVYMVIVGERLYAVSKAKVQKLVEAKGWERETFTTAATVAANQGGHRHGKTKVGLVKMRTLEAAGAMHFVGVL